jgi:hypothetical protein
MITLVTLCWIILLLAFLHIFLLQLSADWQRCTDPGVSVLFGLVSLGGVSFATFWLYCFSHTAGNLFVAVLEIFAVLRFAKSLFSSDGFLRYKQLNAYLLPVTSAALLILFIGLYPFGADWDSQMVPGNRWYKNMPMDNWLPKILADQVWEGSIKRPMVGDWLASDRPPLQAGAYLLVKYFSPATAGIYQVLGTWLQCTVIVPFIFIVQLAGFNRRIQPLAILTLSISAILIINGLFVWPKLLAATYTAIFFVALFQSPQTRLAPRNQMLLAGLSLAFAMLSHSASSFALIGVLIAYLLRQRSKGLRPLFVTCGIATAAYLPWLIYQKIIDPPGDRLMKWHLAGVIPLDHRSFLQTLSDSYSSLTWETWLAGRIENVTRVLADPLWFPRDLSAYLQSFLHGAPDPSPIYVNSFFFFSYAQWFFPPAIILIAYAYLAARRIRPPDVLNYLAGTLLLCVVAWVLLMFSPGSTIIHAGAYFCPIGALLLAMGLLNACSETTFKILSWLSVSLTVPIFMLDQQIQTAFARGIARIDFGYVFLLAIVFLFHCRACRLASRHVHTIEVSPVPAGNPTTASSVVQ